MRAYVDENQVEQFARLLPALGVVRPFDFCSVAPGVLFPPAHHPGALDAFFFNAAHQFGFWIERDGCYDRPMIAPVGGVERKGSDFLFYCTQRALNRDADVFNPLRMSAYTEDDWVDMFADDSGKNPLPMWPEHLEIMRAYPRWLLANATSPTAIVSACNREPKPLAALLAILQTIPGYREDALRKKAMLLAVMLENRPERFLHVTDPESATPIIDYHLQRSALRTGLVRIADAKLREQLEARRIVAPEEEAEIRQATYAAVATLVTRSGLSVAAVDYFFFQNRTRCPEMTEPRCAECPVQALCAKETTLFQPVFRTAAY
ncbi:MAG TPA: queuosine salvage family protein [Kiritimatiellia bacterium]|nr:queuosine salvage family protein [Kiritimatiellia bacterium]HMO98552.1 queuosine salvage family protein [Kiritimatiellia bacterium]HMP97919.1 queuosine salvage family protein [Kiritimatiellia bacterium]